jgi:hypothetical protein
MRDFFNDLMCEEFTKREVVLYGFVAPIVLIIVCLLVGA